MSPNRSQQSATSIPTLQKTFTLETLNAIKVYNRCYRLVDYHLYLASVLVRVRGNTHEFGKEIETVVNRIDTLLEEACTGLDARLETLQTELNVKPQDLQLTYSHPETVTATMRTPRAHRYLECILKLELTCKILYAAWFAGRINDVQRLDMSLTLQRQLAKLSSQINTLAKGLARRVIHQEGRENKSYDKLLDPQTVANEDINTDVDVSVDEHLLDRAISLENEDSAVTAPAPSE